MLKKGLLRDGKETEKAAKMKDKEASKDRGALGGMKRGSTVAPEVSDQEETPQFQLDGPLAMIVSHFRVSLLHPSLNRSKYSEPRP